MSRLVKQKDLDQLVPGRAAARLRAFRRDVDRALAGTVVDVVLFGSRARGEGRSGSDYDVAVFVRNTGDRRTLDHLLSDIAYPHLLRGIHIRPVSVTTGEDGRLPPSALAASIMREGVAIQ